MRISIFIPSDSIVQGVAVLNMFKNLMRHLRKDYGLKCLHLKLGNGNHINDNFMETNLYLMLLNLLSIFVICCTFYMTFFVTFR